MYANCYKESMAIVSDGNVVQKNEIDDDIDNNEKQISSSELNGNFDAKVANTLSVISTTTNSEVMKVTTTMNDEQTTS